MQHTRTKLIRHLKRIKECMRKIAFQCAGARIFEAIGFEPEQGDKGADLVKAAEMDFEQCHGPRLAQRPDDFMVCDDLLPPGFTCGEPSEVHRELIRQCKQAIAQGAALPQARSFHPCLKPNPLRSMPKISQAVLHAAVIVILFSGRRREGDIQHWIEQLADGTRINGRKPAVVLYDLVYGARRDLLDKSILRDLLHGVRSGFIIGMLAGPPCETWSIARWSV